MVKRANAKILENHGGKYAEEYGLLWKYAQELRISNPGSTVICQSCSPDGNLEVSTFLRFYVCLSALKRGWLAGCRPIIGVDGCFLKGPYKCQLLCAIGKDANNQMFPIVWAVVEHETYTHWKWFLTILKDDLQIMNNGATFTIVSDMQKVLILL